MEPHTNSNKQAHAPAQLSLAVGERLAFTPAEFAAFFKKSATWGYRAIYAGKVEVLRNSPRLLIPRAQVEKFISDTAVYDGIDGGSWVLRKSGAHHE